MPQAPAAAVAGMSRQSAKISCFSNASLLLIGL
jgi:hypothetical protein